MTKVTKATKLEDSVIIETLGEYKEIFSPSEADVVDSLGKRQTMLTKELIDCDLKYVRSLRICLMFCITLSLLFQF